MLLPNILPETVVGVPLRIDPLFDPNTDGDCCPNMEAEEDEFDTVEVPTKPDPNVLDEDSPKGEELLAVVDANIEALEVVEPNTGFTIDEAPEPNKDDCVEALVASEDPKREA